MVKPLNQNTGISIYICCMLQYDKIVLGMCWSYMLVYKPLWEAERVHNTTVNETIILHSRGALSHLLANHSLAFKKVGHRISKF